MSSTIPEVDLSSGLDVKQLSPSEIVDLYQLDLKPSQIEHVEVDAKTVRDDILEADSRSYHDRTVDRVLKNYIDDFEENPYDMILREVPYLYTKENTKNSDKDRLVENNQEKGDIDVGLIDLDNLEMRTIEVKSTHNGEKRARNQLNRLAESIQNINQEIDQEWRFYGDMEVAEDISSLYIPPDIEGEIYFEDREKIENSEIYEDMEYGMFKESLLENKSQIEF